MTWGVPNSWQTSTPTNPQPQPSYAGEAPGWAPPMASGVTPPNPFLEALNTSPEMYQLKQGLNFYSGAYAPDLAQIPIQQQQLMQQLGYYGADYNLAAGALNQNYGTDLAKLGIDKAGTQRQIGVNDKLAALAKQLSDLDIQNLQGKVVGQGRQFDAQRRSQVSDATQRGVMGGGSLGNINSLNDIANNKSDAYSQFLRDVQGVNIGQQKNDINFAENKAQLEDRAKGYGISGQELQNHLQQGLAKLGIDKFMNMQNLLNGLASTDVQQQAIAQQIFRAAMENSNMFALPTQGSSTNKAVNYVQNVGG